MSTAAVIRSSPGDIVLPGAVHKMVPVQPGDVFRAEFVHLGPVTVRISKEGTA